MPIQPLVMVVCPGGSNLPACARPVASVVSNFLRPRGLKPTRLLCPWDFPGKCTGVSFHALLQGTFPTQESNPHLLYLLHILLILRKTRLPGFELGAKFFSSKYRTLSRGKCFRFHLGPCYLKHFI